MFDVVLNDGSEWDVAKDSRIDTLAVNNSQVDVANGVELTSDTIGLNDGSVLNIGEGGQVNTDHLTVNTFSTVLIDPTHVIWTQA